jgi:hypothetical protein
MRIISNNTVELTEREQQLDAQHDALLDAGWSTLAAASRIVELNPGLDPAFVRWLRDEPLIIVNKENA